MFSVNPSVTHVVKLEKITLAIFTLWESDKHFLVLKNTVFIGLKSSPHTFSWRYLLAYLKQKK